VAAQVFRADLGELREIFEPRQKRVIFTTSPMPMPASASTARMFRHTTSVCSSMVAGTDPSGAPDLAGHVEPARVGRRFDAVRIGTDRSGN